MYSKKVLIIAAKSSFYSVLWPALVIGAFSLFFATDIPLSIKIGLFVGIQFLCWLAFFSGCILFHQSKMRDSEFKREFLSKDEEEQGRELGTYIEGW
uniref:hypothetical protein n=1 Tax=Microbulbifer agarilyticus TaxID=260552 RepID=UPI000255B660|nr:hypothetical protein [Microbulbifer agarilyticus]